MTQAIDPIKLKAAAEHLDWVCQQYLDVQQVQKLHQGLLTMIEDAKAGRVLAPMDRQSIPFNWAVNAEGLYDEYKTPDIGDAYVAFSVEMRGGLTEQEIRITADIEKQRNEILARGQS